MNAIRPIPLRIARHAAALALATLAGCASYTPTVNVGEPIAAVEARNGAPTGRYPLPGGASRVEYARGPFGKHTWMIDVDAAGRVTAVEQVLTENRFWTIRPGMAADEVLQTLGRPSQVRASGWQPGQYWSYRYETFFCQWFVVGITPERTVRDAGFTPDPICDFDDWDGHH